MARKHPGAVALGRIKTPRKAASSRANGLLGGRPSLYRLTSTGAVEKRVGDHWILLAPPYDAAARRWLGRHRR